jgi:hypothetical protein
MTTTTFPSVGALVGCRYRWPFDHAHPDCWQAPYSGIVLAIDDVRAWTGTLAFPRCSYPDGPPQDKVTAHVQRCLREGLLADSVPVLWTNHDGKQCVQWDSQLSPYADELLTWIAARITRHADLATTRKEVA